MRHRYIGQVVLVCALPAALTAEIQVNVRTSGAQANPAVAAGDTGCAVVVWSSYFSSPGRSNEIFARRLDPNGAAAGEEFQVNVLSEGNQTQPAVAMDPWGGFAVAWQGPGLDSEDIFLRRFDANGLPATDEWLVNARTEGRQLYPRVAVGADTFVVVWESRDAVEDVNRTFVYLRVFEPNGASDHHDVIVDDGLYDCRHPDVAADALGRFVVTWVQERSSNTIMARMFDAKGVPTAEPFTVSTARIASLTRPAVAMDSQGAFVIAWDGDPNRASDDDVYVRLFDPNGIPAGEPFLVNAIQSGAQQWPQVAMSDANEFTVVWEHGMDDPNIATDIFARHFDAAGRPLSDPFRLNTYTPGRQKAPDVAMTFNGSLVAVWESDNQDGSDYGIFAESLPPRWLGDPNSAM